MAHREEFIDVRGIRIKIMRGGSGPELLYLHGAGGGGIWLPAFEILAQNFTVLAPTHPGFAGSDGYDEIDNIHDLVFHYVNLADLLGLRKPFVVGSSLGGWLAAELAVHHPERVGKLVLVGACGLKVEGKLIADFFAPAPDELRRMVFYEAESELARNAIPDLPSPEQLDAILRARQSTARIGWNPFMYDPRLRARLYRVAAPTLVVWGAEDRIVPFEHARAYQSGIAQSRLVTIEKSGHIPLVEQPQPTTRAIAEFLKN